MKTISIIFKTLLLLLLLAFSAVGAEIDTKLYEGPDRDAYYKKVRHQIEAALAEGNLTKEQAHKERQALEMVLNAAKEPAPVERNPAVLLSGTELKPEEYYLAIQAAAAVQVARETLQRKQNDIQSKLSFLKQKIDRVTAEDKVMLLTYQLLFAYYKLQQNNLDAKIDQYKAYGKEIMTGMSKHFNALQCGDAPEKLRAQITQTAVEVETALEQRVAATIALENGELEGSSGLEKLRQTQAAAGQHYSKILEKQLRMQSLLALCLLRSKDATAFFTLLEQIASNASRLQNAQRPQYTAQDDVYRALAKTYIGVTGLVLGDTLHETKALFVELGNQLSAPLFVFNEHPISILSLIKAVLILVFGFFFGMMYKRWIARLARRWPDMSQMSMRLASNIGYYLIVIVALFIAVSSLGIDMTSISLIAGALSIGVGFGLQTVVSNFIAGIILMFERTIRIGDTIEISGELRGRVTDMRIRSTTVKTFDNIDIVVPNSSFIQNNVVNWTLEDRTRRIHIPFGVAYGTDVESVKKAVLDELEASSLMYIKYDPDKKPEVWMVAMSSSSVDFELLIWIEWANKYRPNALRSDFMILIYNALYKHGIQIPFPQLDLYVKQLPKSEA